MGVATLSNLLERSEVSRCRRQVAMSTCPPKRLRQGAPGDIEMGFAARHLKTVVSDLYRRVLRRVSFGDRELGSLAAACLRPDDTTAKRETKAVTVTITRTKLTCNRP